MPQASPSQSMTKQDQRGRRSDTHTWFPVACFVNENPDHDVRPTAADAHQTFLWLFLLRALNPEEKGFAINDVPNRRTGLSKLFRSSCVHARRIHDCFPLQARRLFGSFSTVMSVSMAADPSSKGPKEKDEVRGRITFWDSSSTEVLRGHTGAEPRRSSYSTVG